ncbi:UDP-N-acetylglucosamine transferase subunit ALG14 [Neobacillus sp. MER 74]|uniref:PssD/Cps14F family polysaccharide biosynthesis glycosyltransferase n=1 Tax=Neobacillus sp. MER 74 TaxID=2939566 RepID=UPI00203CA910|nr:PssD/Cps14F family polysaccharide biosynthesis glycosyltransferase [Neobacillus sp. MER 74]MCM3116049.1 UDP-N-acetylglucosamine transferase subunit ALG14 [Neobacillus sp. MER 74]
MESVSSNKRMKICFAASSGGHYEQLMMLKPLMSKYDSFVITEKTTYAAQAEGVKTYYVKQVNRKEKMCIPNLFLNSIISFYIFIKERPNAVICTGVLAMIPMCLFAKLFRKKLIYIESFAKVTSPTETGMLMYRYADQFYVQWEEMLKIYPNAIYLGGIY